MKYIFNSVKNRILSALAYVFGAILIAGLIMPAAALPDYSEWHAGDIAGQTPAPGLYNWGARLHVSADGVTVSGSESDARIFQVAQDLILSDGAMVTLNGGVQASNNTGATLNGRVLAQTEGTLEAAVVTIAPGTTAMGKNGAAPDKITLFKNYSNRFIESSVPSNGKTTLFKMQKVNNKYSLKLKDIIL